MQVSPIGAYNSVSGYNKPLNNNQNERNQVTFEGSYGYAMKEVPKSVLSNLHIIDLGAWDRKTVCEVFENIMREVVENRSLEKTIGFKKMYELYKANGLRGMLYALGQPNSESLQRVMKNTAKYEEVALTTEDYVSSITISNEGPWGFWNNLLGLKSQNEIVLKFRGKDLNDITFSLDKAGDYQVGINYDSEKWSYYAHKDKVKKQIFPKGDLYLPPGV